MNSAKWNLYLKCICYAKYVSVSICAVKLYKRDCFHIGKKDSIFLILKTKLGWSRKRLAELIETPRDKSFSKSQGVCDNGVRGFYFVEESSRRSRARKSSKDKWGHRILRCGRFPSGFPGNTRDVWRTCRGDTAARIRVRGVPRDARPHLYGLSVQDAIPNAVISGKAAA